MTKLRINPGICGLITYVEANSDDGMDVTLTIKSDCSAVSKMFEILGTTFDSFQICLVKPGSGPFYTYTSVNFPGHCACPTIAGIIKAIEVECKLALPKNAEIIFE